MLWCVSEWSDVCGTAAGSSWCPHPASLPPPCQPRILAGLQAAGLESGSQKPGHQHVAAISLKHLYEIALVKQKVRAGGGGSRLKGRVDSRKLVWRLQRLEATAGLSLAMHS